MAQWGMDQTNSTHPLEFNGKYITEMTEGELGSLYENIDMNINADKDHY